MAASFATFTFVDAKGDQSNIAINFPAPGGAVTVASVLSDIQAMAQLVADLAVGQMLSAKIALSADISGLTDNGAAGANSDVEEKGAFIYRTAGGYVTRVSVPTLDEALVVAGSRTINVSAGAGQAFNNMMVSGTGLVNLNPSDYREDDIVSLEQAVEVFRPTRLSRA